MIATAPMGRGVAGGTRRGGASIRGNAGGNRACGLLAGPERVASPVGDEQTACTWRQLAPYGHKRPAGSTQWPALST
jgi:hypothetical protein